MSAKDSQHYILFQPHEQANPLLPRKEILATYVTIYLYGNLAGNFIFVYLIILFL